MRQDNWISFEQLSELLSNTGQTILAMVYNRRDLETCVNALNRTRASSQLTPLTADNNMMSSLLDPQWLATKIPFGDWVSKSISKNNQSSEDDQRRKEAQKLHLLYTLAAMSALMPGRPAGTTSSILIGEGDRGNWGARLDEFILELLTRADAKDREYLPIALPVFALYHDIGKAIADDRHPFEGYHLVNDRLALDSKLLNDFEAWISSRNEAQEARINMFTHLMRYHDLWGNIATGEASLALFSTALELTEENPKRHLTFLACLLLCNLSDTYAPAKHCLDTGRHKGIGVQDVERMLERWKILSEIIGKETSRQPEKIWDDLVDYSQTQREVIKRIYYLLNKAGINTSEAQVTLILRSGCGGWFPAFCRAFGTVRLSYALRFVSKIKKRLVEKQERDLRGVMIWIDVLMRVVKTYESLISTYRKEGRVTGIEMSSLTREDSVAESIVDSLIQQSSGALGWIDDEVSAFPQT